MTDQREQGRELMRRADEAMKAAAAADGLRKRLAEAKTEAEREPIKRDAFDCQGLYPDHAGRFADVVADINRLNGTGPASSADVAALADETRKVNDAATVALRGYVKMEEVAREATEKPLEAALDIYQRLPLGDLARKVRRAILESGSQRKAVKALKAGGIKISQTKISHIVNNEILPAYAKAGIPVERIFLLRPSTAYRQAPIDNESTADPDLYPNSTENDDG